MLNEPDASSLTGRHCSRMMRCMRLLDEHTAELYLRERGHLSPGEPARVRELAGGVSNMVLLVERPANPAGEFVLKQSRPQLRTRQAWFANVERIWREAEVLRLCQQLSAAASGLEPDSPPARQATTPRILFEDRENYLFAMTAAPRPHHTWKAELLAGKADERIATACGALLGRLHGGSWSSHEIARQIGDRTLFEQLRVEPYYRTLAAARPDAKAGAERLIASLAEHPRSLVHADFSPKNLLVSAEGLWMVDFETGHYGDPAFDLGFFLSHLVLKACHHIPRHTEYLRLADVFAREYNLTMAPFVSGGELAELWTRGLQNLAGCAWARLDGKSPVEYLTDEARRELIRDACRETFDNQPRDWPAAATVLNDRFTAASSRLTSSAEIQL